MNRRVLLVDDDLMLLSSMRRCIGSQYELSTSASGEEALSLMERSEPFAAIITDMRMPRMDGIEFIKNARRISPDSMYLMLTGNQDAKTAVRAMNEGQVKRFLNKPCDPAEISAEIDLALRQYEVESHERELLSETLIDVTQAYSRIIEKLAPQLQGRHERTAWIMESIREKLRVTSRWEYSLAPNLLQLGYALSLAKAEPADSWKSAAREVISTVQAIPRMSTIVQILSSAVDYDITDFDDTSANQEVISTGSALVRAACVVEEVTSHEIEPDLYQTEVPLAMEGMSPAYVEAAISTCLEFMRLQGEHGAMVDSGATIKA